MTALVGQNGAGKTNLLRGIMELGKRAFGQTVVKSDADDRKVRSGASEWLISASWSGLLRVDDDEEQSGSWGVRIGPQKKTLWLWRTESEDDKSWVPCPQDALEKIPAWYGGNPTTMEMYSALSGEVEPGKVVRTIGFRLDSLWGCPYFKTAGGYLQKPSYSENSTPFLSEDCSDLAWVIAYLKGDKDECFAEITESLRKVVPTFLRVRNRPAPVNRVAKKEIVINKESRLYDEEQTVMGQELRFDMASGLNLAASAISEGTLITLAVLTAIMHDSDQWKGVGTKTILLDDIESGLHPSAQRDLIRQLQRLQDTRPELQIIFSSHSPYIIDEMRPGDVWLFAPDKEGIAHCAKLSDHPDAKRALEVLTTGEFWSAEGENWVLDRAKQSNEEAAAAK